MVCSLWSAVRNLLPLLAFSLQPSAFILSFMPVFQYEAVDSRGRTLTGIMPASDETNLEQKLRNAGLWLTQADVQRPRPSVPLVSTRNLTRFKLRGGRGRRELIDFCTLMSFQLAAGITLVRALDVACQDCKTAGFKEVLYDVQRQIESGLQLHEGMAKYPRVFSTHFVSVVKAGESTSNLPEGFKDLKEYLEWVERMLADVRQATIYPAIVLTVMSVFMVFLFTFIIPRFSSLLAKLHVAQPWLTRFVFAVGNIAEATWMFWLPELMILALVVVFGPRFSKRIALAVDTAILRLPLFGELNRMLALSRFSHNLSILYRSGLPILQSLDLCRHGLIGNAVVERAIGVVAEDVKTGSTISEAMHRHPIFTALLLRMVAMGESSGTLDHALNNVSSYYNEVIPRRIKNLFSVFEPTLMLVLIGMVGCVALAIYLPILSLMSAIK
jgi:type II secretory pathway component PulF